jgi:hypothetical protein
MSTKNVLGQLADANGYVTLGLAVAGELVPLGKALVQEVKQIATGATTETYQVLLQIDGAELDAIAQLSEDDLAAVNAELAKLGIPPVPSPIPPTPIVQDPVKLPPGDTTGLPPVKNP